MDCNVEAKTIFGFHEMFNQLFRIVIRNRIVLITI